MTENEAKEKICCGSRNCDTCIPDLLCVASRCMAWRWIESKRTAAFLEAVQAHMHAQAKPNFNAAVQSVYAERGGQFERVEGFCGLAGSIS